MRENFNRFFNLTTNPFGETPDPRFYFESTTHRMALEGLLQSVRLGKGFTLLTGEVGTGKTLLSRLFLKSLGEKTDSALILYPRCTEAELIRTILEELEIEIKPRVGATSENPQDTKYLLDSLNAMLLSEHRRDRRTVLVIDEAHNLPPATLETIRLLGNLETEQRKLLNIVLIAQPELEARLAENDCRQLRQRIGASLTLQPLRTAETEGYIKHRLECAGGANLVRFEPEAVALIQQIAQGIPREINRICERMLTISLNQGIRLIRKADVRDAFERKNDSRLGRFLRRFGRDEGRSL